jgi:hypothetical protein
MLNYNIDSLINITYTKLINDAVLVKDVLGADMPAVPADILEAILTAIATCLKEPYNTPDIQKITYYILQRLSFSVAKLRPVKHFMQTYLDFKRVNDRLKYVRGKQAEERAKTRVVIAATDSAAESAGVKTDDIKTVPNEHVERLASARAAIEALRETPILPYSENFRGLIGDPINFDAPVEREKNFPALPFFRPTSIDDGVLPPMIWKNTETPVLDKDKDKIESAQRSLKSKSESILKCVKDAFNLLRQPVGCGPAAEEAIRTANKFLNILRRREGAEGGAAGGGANSPPKRGASGGAAGAGGKRQRKTRFRKRQTQKRKTRKNRKQQK